LGTMAGTVDIVERSFAGIEIFEDVLYFCPNMPEEIERLNLNIRYRGQAIAIALNHSELRVTTGGNPVSPVRVGFGGQVVELPPFSCHVFALSAEHPLDRMKPGLGNSSEDFPAPGFSDKSTDY
ncbi:MAG: glycosyl hydrolase family 65 protein, partial [Bradymonadaceae bacterium]